MIGCINAKTYVMPLCLPNFISYILNAGDLSPLARWAGTDQHDNCAFIVIAMQTGCSLCWDRFRTFETAWPALRAISMAFLRFFQHAEWLHEAY
eukprot:1509493-Pleurochrysis_carterae.AAC.4